MVCMVVLGMLVVGMNSASYIDPSALRVINSFTRNCELVYIDENSGYGLRATRDIRYGETVMVVPPIYMLTSFDRYPWLGKFESYSSEFRLTIRLLYEKFVVKESSNRKLLVESLPKNFSNVFTFTPKQKSKFGEYFNKNINYNFPVNCISDHEIFIKLADKNIKNCIECLKFDNFFWACQAIFTRAYTYYKSDHFLLTQNQAMITGENIKGTALILGADMFNHYPMPRPEKFVDDYGINYVGDPAHVDVRADRTTLAGEEVFISYGPKSNIELYLIHGFVLENNTDDYGIIGVPSDGANCENYKQKHRTCEFYIKAKELSVEMINFLFFKIFKTQTQFQDFFDLLEKRKQGYIEEKNFIKVLSIYKIVLDSYSIDRCKGEIKVGKKIDMNDMLEKLCQENHWLYMSHMLRLDYFLLSMFHKALIKV